jgi:amidophosphoribosyltransferase
LVAHNRTIEEIRDFIGCDALIYQDVDAMKSAIFKLAPDGEASKPAITGFDASCFDGIYVTGDIKSEDIARLNGSRIKQTQSTEGEEDSSRLALPNLSE